MMGNKYAVMVYLSNYYGQYTKYKNLNYAYRNTLDFTKKLQRDGWNVFPPVSNMNATKRYCIDYLVEKISGISDDDWFLFYFVGHGDRYSSSSVGNIHPTYMVTSLFGLPDDKNSASSYFTDEDYTSIINLFKNRAPNGHLITVLDCCYAFGVIDNYSMESSFHTVFAAANGKTKSAYSDNSFFFKSFKSSWAGRNFEIIKRSVERNMRENFEDFSFRNFCEIQVASKFKNFNF